MPDTETFSGWFRDLLQRRGKTYAEAGKELGVSPSTTWQWAHRKRSPKGTNLVELARWAGVSAEEITRRINGATEKTTPFGA